jgi:hypothetical protein
VRGDWAGREREQETTYAGVFPVVHLGRDQREEAVKGLCMVAQALLEQGNKDQRANFGSRVSASRC